MTSLCTDVPPPFFLRERGRLVVSLTYGCITDTTVVRYEHAVTMHSWWVLI